MIDNFYYFEICVFLVTFPLYVFILVCLLYGWSTKKTLNEPFFKLCFVNGIVDIAIFTNNNIGNVLPKACILPNLFFSSGPVYLHVYFFFAWGGGLAQGLCAIIIAFNRMMILRFPGAARRTFNPRYIWIFYLLMTVPGILAGSITLFVDVGWERRGECSVVGLIDQLNNDGSTSISRLFFKIAAVFLFLTAVVIIIIYSIIFIHIRKLHNRHQTFTVTSTGENLNNKKMEELHMRREWRLLIMSGIVCSLQILYTVYIIIRELFAVDKQYIGLNFFADVCTMVNPYLLLIFSKSVRRTARQLIFMCLKKSLQLNQQTVAMPSRSPAPSREGSKVISHHY